MRRYVVALSLILVSFQDRDLLLQEWDFGRCPVHQAVARKAEHRRRVPLETSLVPKSISSCSSVRGSEICAGVSRPPPFASRPPLRRGRCVVNFSISSSLELRFKTGAGVIEFELML